MTVPSGELRHRFPTVVLRRALTRSRELYERRRRIVDGKADGRLVAIVSALDHVHAHADLAALLEPACGPCVVETWTLHRARISKHVSGPFNARCSAVAMEGLTLAYERLEIE